MKNILKKFVSSLLAFTVVFSLCGVANVFASENNIDDNFNPYSFPSNIELESRSAVYSCGNVPSFRRNGYRCSGRSIPSDRNRIPPASFWLVRVYSLNAGSSPYTSLMDL